MSTSACRRSRGRCSRTPLRSHSGTDAMGAKFLFSGVRGIRRGVWDALSAPRLDPLPRVGPCPVHPSWTPNPDGPLVAASRALCPFCREERAAVEAQATRVEDERVIALHRVGVTPELDRIYVRHLETHT